MQKILHRALLFLFASVLACGAQPAFQPDREFTNELNNVRALLRSQQPKLATNELNELAATLARSNRLAQIIPELLFQPAPDFTNIASLLKDFPAGVDKLQRYGQSLLSSAISENKPDLDDFLLEQKADPDGIAGSHERPIFKTLQYGRYDLALKLVRAGASITRTNNSGESAASQIFQNWHPGNASTGPMNDLIPLMLERGLDPFAPIRSGSQTSILEECLARESGYYGSFNRLGTGTSALFSDLLLTNNPSPARRTPLGDTALHLAARWERTNAVRFLLAAGFTLGQTNNSGLTPLQSIVGEGRISAHGNPISIRSGSAPLLPGQPAPPQTITEWLLAQGATLDIFSAAGLDRTNELAAMLRTNAALASVRDGFGRTPLHYVVLNAGGSPGLVFYGGMGGAWSGDNGQGFFMPQGGSIQVPAFTNPLPTAITVLLAAGADSSAATTKLVPQQRFTAPLPVGATPLQLAARNGNTPVLRLLLISKAVANAADADGNTALHFAARTWQSNGIPLLLAARAPLEATNLASQTPLRAAVEASVSTAAGVLLDAGANRTNGLGKTTLMHIAAERSDVATLTVLLKHRFQIEARDAEGRTPFQKAVARLAWPVVTFLHDKGANLHATNFSGDTALHLISAQQNDTVHHQTDEGMLMRWEREQLSAPGSMTAKSLNWLIKSKILNPLPAPRWTNTSLTAWLIGRGAEVNATNRAGRTPLLVLSGAEWMRWFHHSEKSNRVMTLLNAGASLELADTNGLTPLHVAATNEQPHLFQFLLAKAGPQLLNRPDAQGRTLLHRAIESSRNNVERVTALLALGANVNIADKQGRTPLHLAAQFCSDSDGYGWGRGSLTFALLTNGASPNLTDHEGRTPLNIACNFGSRAFDRSRIGTIQTLLTNKADPNIADRDGNTPLHRLAQAYVTNLHYMSMREPLEAMLKLGANPALTNRAGQAPLHFLANSSQSYPHTLELMHDMLAPSNAAFSVHDHHGNTPLHLWARSMPDCGQCADRFGTILEWGANASLTNFAGQTPATLMLTVSNRPWMSRALLSRGISAESLAAPDHNGQPLLHRLMARLNLNFYDTPQSLRRIFTNKSLVNLTNAEGDTPLHIAVRRADYWTPRILMEAGADPFVKNARGETPLRLASIHMPSGSDEVRPPGTRYSFFLSLRMRDPADADRWLEVDPGLAAITNKFGITPLMTATEMRRTNLVNRLLELGAPMDALSAMRLGRLDEFRKLLPAVARPLPVTWAFDAVRFGQFEALQELVAAGANVHTNDSSGHSLLYRARAAKEPEMVHWLKARGCRESFFDVLVEGDVAKAAAFIADNPGCVTNAAPDGRPPFITAVATAKPEMVSLLLEHGAGPGTLTDERWSALHVAAAYDAVEIGQMLLKAGATNSETSSSMTPLQIAAAYGATNMIKLLIQNGANVNVAAGGAQNSPLHWAAHMGRPNTVRLLLSLGADVNAKNYRNGGETPLALARVSGDGNNMGFGIPPEVRLGYPGGVNRPAEARAAVVKLLEEAAAKPQ